MKLLLDADMLTFRVVSACQVEACLGEDMWTRFANIAEARERYWEEVDHFVEFFGTTRDDVIHCFTDRSTFRKEICPEYKANRKNLPKPIGFRAFKDELLEMPNAIMHDMVEADDLLGIFATQLKAIKENYAILSGDKDLRQIPGFRYWIGDAEAEYNSVADSNRQFWTQALTGDATDNVRGCPGYGPKTAEKAVSGFDFEDTLGCWEKVVECFGKKGESEAYALQQARLVRILRSGEYDFNSRTVSLWNPRKTLNV